MALYGYPDLTVSVDNTGGTPVAVTAYVTNSFEWLVEAVVEEITAAGDSADRYAAVGLTRKGTVELAGPLDDVATGLEDTVKRSEIGETRTLTLNFGDAAINVEAIIMSVATRAAPGALSQYVVTLRPTGAIT